MAYIYLLHFDSPISPNHTTQHYTGSAEDITKRIRDHQRGYGSRLTEVAYQRQIPFTVVRLWRGNRSLEQRLKSLKHSPKFCPICSPKKVWNLFHVDMKPTVEIKNLNKKLGDLVKCS